MKCFGAHNSYIITLCIYGYSYSVFIPVILLCSSGYVVMQWIVLSYGFVSELILICLTTLTLLKILVIIINWKIENRIKNPILAKA